MDREPVNSRSIRAIGYDAATQVLEIEFHNTGCYQYFSVPEAAYTDLMLARSKGEHFNHDIKDQFSCRRISQ
jgi:hypothetical protein